MRTIVSIASLGLCVAAGMALANLARRGPTTSDLTELVRTRQDTAARFNVWYVFRVADCDVAARLIKQLGVSNRSQSVASHAVVLSTFDDTISTSSLGRQLGFTFDIQLDTAGTWGGALKGIGMDNPVVIVTDRQRILGIAGPELIVRARQIIPDFLSSGIDR